MVRMVRGSALPGTYFLYHIVSHPDGGSLQPQLEMDPFFTVTKSEEFVPKYGLYRFVSRE